MNTLDGRGPVEAHWQLQALSACCANFRARPLLQPMNAEITLKTERGEAITFTGKGIAHDIQYTSALVYATIERRMVVKINRRFHFAGKERTVLWDCANLDEVRDFLRRECPEMLPARRASDWHAGRQ
jgi:hypothetical protein